MNVTSNTPLEGWMKTVSGVLPILLVLTLTPVHGRILYMFLFKLPYCKLEVYGIMAHIEIIQLLSVPGIFMMGVAQFLGYDPGNIVILFFHIISVSSRIEPALSFVLALNRLKIMCKLGIPRWANMVFYIVIYIYGTLTMVALFTPWCGLHFTVGENWGEYDFSKPYTCLLRFITEAVLMGVHRNMPPFHNQLVNFIFFICFASNAIVLPPVTLLIVNRSFANDFFARKGPTTLANIASIKPTGPPQN
ncbi:hypothetical protein L596_026714 [Steinernema carpocapsae]|uniref:7TM GPCR serpentine receptor class x (Srx) domain-containing protein n=1 Tax=Steinernema carpocapsae TaxID=34508 RepID=A0A4U5M257_STECR|nr:hypothetical protein L596_026714 [Steinernema carpocapsae]